MRRFRHLALVPLLAAMAVVSACGTGDSRAVPTPTEPQPILFGWGDQQQDDFTLLNQPLLAGLRDLKISKLIGIEGGQLTLLGATLVVPRGAVTKPTLFSLIALPTGHVEVQLGATIDGLLGLVFDVGGRGFREPVELTLSYKYATNVTDPSKLTVVYAPGLLGYRDLQALPSTVNEEEKTVTAKLPHFSRYLLASPH